MISIALYFTRYIYGYLISFFFCCKYCCGMFLFLEGLDRRDIILSVSISCPKKKTACMCYITIVGAQGLAAVSVKLPAVATKCPDWMVLRLKWLSKKSIATIPGAQNACCSMVE
jgi:hypothetical protein